MSARPSKVIKKTVDQYEEMTNEMLGICIDCGDDSMTVEPDAERYTCEVCNQPSVYGVEQLLMLGWLEIVDDDEDEDDSDD